MAVIDVRPPDDLIQQLNALDNRLDSIQDKMLSAGINAVEGTVKSNMEKSLTGQYETGALRKSIAVKSRTAKKGKEKMIYFKGSAKRKGKKGKAVRNGFKAAMLEYGRPGQQARPFMRPAFKEKRQAIYDAMKRTFEEETKDLQN